MKDNRKQENIKLSYESDGKMEKRSEEEIAKQKEADFFNITPSSE